MALKKGTAVRKPATEETPVEEVAEAVVETVEAESPVEALAAVEADQEEEVVVAEEAPTQQVAAVAANDSPNRNLASTDTGSSFAENAAAQGMDGLELGYGSFPNIKLDDGEFIDGDGNNYPSPFYFTPISSKGVYAYSQKNEDDSDVFFSYDGVTTTKGESVAALCAEWVEDGYTVERDTRLEVNCLIQEQVTEANEEGVETPTGEFVEGEMVMLSLPPTARKKYSGKWAMAERLYKNAGKGLDEMIMKAEIGKSVKVGTRSFRPWMFGYIKP